MKGKRSELSHTWPGPGRFRSVGPLGAAVISSASGHDYHRSETGPTANVAPNRNAPPNKSAWQELEEILTNVYNFAHNKREFAEKHGKTPAQAVLEKLAEVKDGSDGDIRRRSFTGPKVFLRLAGKNKNRVYSGEWWFDIDLLSTIEKSYARIYFNNADKRQVIRDLLREYLAIAMGWNAIDEIWALELPRGEEITGFESKVARQKLFHDLPLSAKGNRMLVGYANQIFFPVKNPLWITRYRDLTP